jgi:hypothetical protein
VQEFRGDPVGLTSDNEELAAGDGLQAFRHESGSHADATVGDKDVASRHTIPRVVTKGTIQKVGACDFNPSVPSDVADAEKMQPLLVGATGCIRPAQGKAGANFREIAEECVHGKWFPKWALFAMEQCSFLGHEDDIYTFSRQLQAKNVAP